MLQEHNRQKCRRYREKLKADPARYEVYRSMEMTRLQHFRKTMNPEQRARMNEMARHRNQAKRYSLYTPVGVGAVVVFIVTVFLIVLN